MAKRNKRKKRKKKIIFTKWIAKQRRKKLTYCFKKSLILNTIALALLVNASLLYYFDQLLNSTPLFNSASYRFLTLFVDIIFLIVVFYLNRIIVFPAIINRINKWLFPRKRRTVRLVFTVIVAIVFLFFYQDWTLGYTLRSHKTKIAGMFFHPTSVKENYSPANFSGLSYNTIDVGVLSKSDISSTYGRCLRTFRWAQYIEAVEKKYSIEKNLLAGLIMQESYGNPLQVNSRNDGGAGLMMFQPGTAQEYGLKTYGASTRTGRDNAHGRSLKTLLQEHKYNYEEISTIDERFHVAKSIDAGGRFLKDLYVRFGSWDKALSAYNRGKPAVLPHSTTHVKQCRFFQKQYASFLASEK